MTNINTNPSIIDENGQMNRNQGISPFLLKPACKDYLWGGERLATEYGKEYGIRPLAETWECSTHPDGVSSVDSGIYKGMPLDTLIKQHPEILGKHPVKVGGKNELPILVKLIDAGANASIQVHPDDAYASKYEKGENGKAEMWYVLDACEDSRLVYGFYQDVDAQAVEAGVEDGTIEKYLRKIKVQKDDVFYIKPGCVHAIGAGMLIAEIQQNSNLTYRLYDYNRKDKDGNLRPLHVKKALEVADLRGDNEPKQPMRILKYQPGCATELLCRCKYFQVERMLVNTEDRAKGVELSADEESFIVLMCIEGTGIIKSRDDIHFHKGHCIFVPAGCRDIEITGRMQFLKIRC